MAKIVTMQIAPAPPRVHPHTASDGAAAVVAGNVEQDKPDKRRTRATPALGYGRQPHQAISNNVAMVLNRDLAVQLTSRL